MSRFIKSNRYSECSGEYLRNSTTDFSDIDGASQHSSRPVSHSPLSVSLPPTRPVPLQYNTALYETWCANNKRPKAGSRPHLEKVHPENGGNASENEDKKQENCETRPEYRSPYDYDYSASLRQRDNEIGFPVQAHVSYVSVDPTDSTCSTPSRGEIRIPLAICGNLMDVLGSRRPDAMPSGVWQQGEERQREERQRFQRQSNEMQFDDWARYVERSGNGRQSNEWRMNERQGNERQSNDIQSNEGRRNEQQCFASAMNEQTHDFRRSNEWFGVEKEFSEEKSGDKQSGDNEQVYEWSDNGQWVQRRKEQDGRRNTLEPPRQRLPEQEVKGVPSAREQELKREPQKRKPGSGRENTPAASHHVMGLPSQVDLNSMLGSLERTLGQDVSSTDTLSCSSTPRRRSPPPDASFSAPAILIPRPPSASKERLFKAHLSEHGTVKESGDGEELKRESGTEKEIQRKPRPPSSSKERLYKAHLSQHRAKMEDGDSEGRKGDVTPSRDAQREGDHKPAHVNQTAQEPGVSIPNLDSTEAVEKFMSAALVEDILNNLHGSLPTSAEREKEINVIHEAPTQIQPCLVEMDPRQAFALIHEQQALLRRDLPPSPAEHRPFYGVPSPRHRPGTARHNVPADQPPRSKHNHRDATNSQLYSSILGATLNGKITDFDNQEMWDELYNTADRHTENETSDGDVLSSISASRSSRLKKGKKLLSTASIRHLNSKKNSGKRSFVNQTEKDLQRNEGEDVLRYATLYISKLIEKTVDRKLAGRRKQVSRQVCESTSGSTVKLQDSSTKRKPTYKDELALHIVKSEIDRLDDDENPLTGRMRLQRLKKMQNGHLQHITREVEQLMAINWCLDDHDQMHSNHNSTSRKTSHREE